MQGEQFEFLKRNSITIRPILFPGLLVHLRWNECSEFWMLSVVKIPNIIIVISSDYSPKDLKSIQ